MSCFQFPQKVISGIDSFEKLFDKDYESVLIISDGNLSQKSGALLKIKRKFDAILTRNETIISDDATELFDKAKKYADVHMPEAIIAIGDGKTLDCGRAVSRLCEIPLVTVIETLPSALTDFETLDIFLYKNSADICIIDPSFINISDSSKIAYEALGIGCLALESAVISTDRYISALAQKSFYEIYKNIMPAYRGEISARENLCNAMLSAYTAFINSFEYSWQSDSFRIASFFSKWSSNRISTLAVAFPSIAEHLYEKDPNGRFSLLAKGLDITPLSEIAPMFLNEEIRRIQATTAVPFALKNFLIDEDEFIASCGEISEEDKDLFYRCYYGSITFIKS
ncbi:MAG: iron-containing alcohol dehydrogenase [Clostridia bacterium]|nr:iron-containing alcohol dehydrogenase [Clostridia bacterium]